MPLHISRKSPYTPYIVDNQPLKSLHNSLHFLESPYIVEGQRFKSSPLNDITWWIVRHGHHYCTWRPPLRRATSITAQEVPKPNIQAPEKIPDPGTECLPALADGHSFLLASGGHRPPLQGKCFKRFSTKCNGHPLEHILKILFREKGLDSLQTYFDLV